MVRIFIAFEPSQDIRNRVAETGKTLLGSGTLSPVPPSLMHITLKFLGEIPESSLPEPKEAADTLHTVPYFLSVSRISTFGRPPRVIKAEVHDGGKTEKLAGQLDSVLKPLGYPPESRPFSPHITVARVKSYHPALLQKIRDVHDTDFGSCEISELLIKKSVLTPSGPIYTTVYRRAL